MKKPPFEDCPRFDTCSVNVCPLDPDQGLRFRLPGEPRCTLAKSRRARIGAEHRDTLPLAGLTGREDSARRVWDALPEAEKTARRAAVTARLGALRDTRI